MGQCVDSGFVERHDLAFDPLGSSAIQLAGTIYCQGNLRIDVRKVLEILSGEGGDALVQSVEYSYAAIQGGVGTIFRYCSPHADRSQAGDLPHHYCHHLHEYSVPGEAGDGIVTELGDYDFRGYPTLREIIDRLAGWYYERWGELSPRPSVSKSRGPQSRLVTTPLRSPDGTRSPPPVGAPPSRGALGARLA